MKSVKPLLLMFSIFFSTVFCSDLIPLLDKKPITPARTTPLDHDLAIAQENLQKLNKENETAQISLHAAMIDNEQACEKFEKELADTKQELASTKDLCAMTEKAYQAMVVERDNAVALAKTAHADRTAALQEKEKIEHEKEQAIASCNEGEQALSAANTIIKQEKYRVKMLQGKLDKQVAASKPLEEKVAVATAAHSKAEAELVATRATLEQEKAKSRKSTQQLETMRDATEKLKEEFTKQRDALAATNKQLEKELAHATDSCRESKRLLTAVQDALEQEKAHSEELEIQLSDVRSEHERREQESKQQFDAQIAVNKQLEKDLAAERAEKEAVQKNCSAACERETLIEADKENLTTAMNELKKDVKKRALSIALGCNSIKGRLLERGRTTFGQVQEMLDTLVVPEVKRLKTIVS